MAFVHSNKIDDNEPAWGQVDKTKLPLKAFANQDVADPEKVTTWKLPHHHVRNGTNPDAKGRFTDGNMFLNRRGLAAAFAAMQGARIGRPMDVTAKTRAHIMKHREAIQEKSADEWTDYLENEITILKNNDFTENDIKEIYADSEGIDVDEVYGEIEKRKKRKKDIYAEETVEKGSIEVKIVKADKHQQLVTAIVYEPDVVDSHNNFMKADQILNMAQRFGMGLQTGDVGIDFMHAGDNGSGLVTQSFIAPVDFKLGTQTIKKGAWVMEVKVLDKDVWEAILAGDITGFSMAGHGETIRKSEEDVVTIINFDSDKFNKRKVKKWLKINGFEDYNCENTVDKYKVVLCTPGNMLPGTIDKVEIENGITAIVGEMKDS